MKRLILAVLMLLVPCGAMAGYGRCPAGQSVVGENGGAPPTCGACGQDVPLSVDSDGNLRFGGINQSFPFTNSLVPNTDVLGSWYMQSLNVPSGVAVTHVGLSGGTQYCYQVAAADVYGTTFPTAEICDNTGNASLGASPETITWVGVPGAVGYEIYGRTTGAEQLLTEFPFQPSNQPLSFMDDGTVTPTGAASTVNSTGSIYATGSVGAQQSLEIFSGTGGSHEAAITLSDITLAMHIGAVGLFGSAPATSVVFDLPTQIVSDNAVSTMARMPLRFDEGTETALVANESMGTIKTVAAITIENIILDIKNSPTCSVSEQITCYDCGTSAGACTAARTSTIMSAITIVSGATRQSVSESINTANVAAGHYISCLITAGACTASDNSISMMARPQ